MRIISLLTIIIISAGQLFGQSGPANGSVNSGVTVNTNNFGLTAKQSDRFRMFNKFREDVIQAKPTGRENDNYIMDPSYTLNKTNDALDSIIVFEKFGGIPQTNAIPPDPYIAVGPNHIIQTVNTSFRISDKEGNTIKTISADSWFNSVLPGYPLSSFDPKVMYDHFSQRWVMIWLDQNDNLSQSYYLVSVSDDDDPTGVWYNWALPSNINGTTPSGGWSDYQGVGYDDKAIYVTANQFNFSTSGSFSYQYTKIRIIKKADLYAGTAGSVNWKDYWNIFDFGLRPARMLSTSSQYYFMATRSGGGSIVALYKLSDPLGSPVLTKTNISVTAYLTPPNADQLGGGSPLLEGGGANLRNEPLYRDGILHAVHSVRNSSTPGLSSIRYLAINPVNNSVVKDFAMGDNEHYFMWPAVAVSSMNDVIITFSRSSVNEYIGAYYTILRAGSTVPVGSITLEEGKANYVKTFGGTRNRWGDYMGAWVDPADENNFWIYTEYVLSTNTWANMVGGIRVIPFNDIFVFSSTKSLDFGSNEVTTSSNEKTVTIKNYGSPDLIISNISNPNQQFTSSDNFTFPITLTSYDSLVLHYQFTPSADGEITDSIAITSNDPGGATKYIGLRGFGYIINSVDNGVFYAATFNASSKLLTIDTSDVSGSEIGLMGLPDVYSLTINPGNNQIYGLSSTDTSSSVIRVNAAAGDSYIKFDISFRLDAISFDTDGTLYGMSSDQKLYTINISNGQTLQVSNVDIKVSAMAFNQAGILWANADADSIKENIYTIDKTNGNTTLVGNSGNGFKMSDMTFDPAGVLYGLSVKAFNRSYLSIIDQSSGTATELGRVNGFNGIKGIVFSSDSTTSVASENSVIPSEFNLSQNYPNPFNPTTNISFALPVGANIRLSIFNLLGQEVAVLIKGYQNAGYHSFIWNSSNNRGVNLSSGVYFFRLKATGTDGREFLDSKKMMLLK